MDIFSGRDFSSVRLLGGRLCLDFVNTIDTRYPQFDGEYLTCYSDLLSWSQYVGVLSTQETATLARIAVHEPNAAEYVFRQAIQLREAIYRIFVAVIHKRATPEDDLTLLNATLSNALPNLVIEYVGTEFHWHWIGNPNALDRMLWIVSRSVADVLTSVDISQIHVCPEDQGCGWLFLDTSKNHSRRWCSMETCGNVAKARRHYRKQRVSEG